MKNILGLLFIPIICFGQNYKDLDTNFRKHCFNIEASFISDDLLFTSKNIISYDTNAVGVQHNYYYNNAGFIRKATFSGSWGLKYDYYKALKRSKLILSSSLRYSYHKRRLSATIENLRIYKNPDQEIISKKFKSHTVDLLIQVGFEYHNVGFLIGYQTYLVNQNISLHKSIYGKNVIHKDSPRNIILEMSPGLPEFHYTGKYYYKFHLYKRQARIFIADLGRPFWFFDPLRVGLEMEI